eukprot:s433_g8.t1
MHTKHRLRLIAASATLGHATALSSSARSCFRLRGMPPEKIIFGAVLGQGRIFRHIGAWSGPAGDAAMANSGYREGRAAAPNIDCEGDRQGEDFQDIVDSPYGAVHAEMMSGDGEDSRRMEQIATLRPLHRECDCKTVFIFAFQGNFKQAYIAKAYTDEEFTITGDTSTAEDAAFDCQVGALQEAVLDDSFQDMLNAYCREHCHHFEAGFLRGS